MALYPCANCGNKVSDSGISCPKCGYSIEKTIEKIQNEEEFRHIREIQLECIDETIQYYQEKVQSLTKIRNEKERIEEHLSKLVRMYLAILEGERYKVFSEMDEIATQIQKNYSAIYEKAKIETEKREELIEGHTFDTKGLQGQSTICPECEAVYSATLLECPSCGWTADRTVAEEYRRYEQKKIRTFILELHNKLEQVKEKLEFQIRWEPWSESELRHFLAQIKEFRDTVKNDYNAPLWNYMGKTYYPADDEEQGIIFDLVGAANPVTKTPTLLDDRQIAAECMSSLLTAIFAKVGREPVTLNEQVEAYYPLVFDMLNTLHRREKEVLTLHFGVADGRRRTLEEVGNQFDITRERVREIEAKALRKLSHPSRSNRLKEIVHNYSK